MFSSGEEGGGFPVCHPVTSGRGGGFVRSRAERNESPSSSSFNAHTTALHYHRQQNNKRRRERGEKCNKKTTTTGKERKKKKKKQLAKGSSRWLILMVGWFTSRQRACIASIRKEKKRGRIYVNIARPFFFLFFAFFLSLSFFLFICLLYFHMPGAGGKRKALHSFRQRSMKIPEIFALIRPSVWMMSFTALADDDKFLLQRGGRRKKTRRF